MATKKQPETTAAETKQPETTAAETKQRAVQQSPPREVARPTGMGQIAGLEGVEKDMLVIPRIKVVQRTSVESSDVSPGSLVNSVTKDVLSEWKKSDPAKIVIFPVLNNRTRILFAPIGSNTGILCRSFDGKHGEGEPGGRCLTCPKNQWGKDGEPPECTELLNVYCAVRDYEMPIPLVLSFGRSSAQTGKQLVNFFYMASQRERISPWNFAYEISTEEVRNDKGIFHVLKVRPAGKAEPAEVEQGELFYNLIKASNVQIHEDEGEMNAERENMQKQNETTQPVEDEEVPF